MSDDYHMARPADQVRAYNELMRDFHAETGFALPKILQPKGGTVKLIVRHEPATSQNAPEDTCVWAVGDDGETTSTAYLKEGEQIEIQIGTEVKGDAEQGQVVDPSVTFGEVVPEQEPVSGETAGTRPGEDQVVDPDENTQR